MTFEQARAYLESLGVRVGRLDGFGFSIELPLGDGRLLKLEAWNGCPPTLGWIAVDGQDVDSPQELVAEGAEAA